MESSEKKSLLGPEFKVVEGGAVVDGQVFGVATYLPDQHESLLWQQMQLYSLQKQAIKEAMEANKLAERIKCEAQSEAARLIGEAKEKARQIVRQAQRQAKSAAEDEVARILEEARRQAAVITETVNKQAASEIKSLRHRLLPVDNLVDEAGDMGETEDVVPTKGGGASVPGLPVAPSRDGVSESLTSETNLDTDLATLLADTRHPEGEREGIDLEGESAMSSSPSGDSPLLEGEVEIFVAPPTSMARLIQLRRALQDVLHLKVLRTAGSLNKGSVFTVFLDRPQPLVSMLQAVPEVGEVELRTGGMRSLMLNLSAG